MKEIKRIQCRGDDGRDYTVIEYGHMVVHNRTSGAKSEAVGSIEYLLSDGRHVNIGHENGTFQILQCNTILRAL